MTSNTSHSIRKHVGEFCKRYPELRRDGVLLEAIMIACNTEKRFKPELGHDFSTPLRHALKGLNRCAKKETVPDYARWPPEEKRSNREFDPQPFVFLKTFSSASITNDRAVRSARLPCAVVVA
jgi:hypothetical protein